MTTCTIIGNKVRTFDSLIYGISSSSPYTVVLLQSKVRSCSVYVALSAFACVCMSASGSTCVRVYVVNQVCLCESVHMYVGWEKEKVGGKGKAARQGLLVNCSERTKEVCAGFKTNGKKCAYVTTTTATIIKVKYYRILSCSKYQNHHALQSRKDVKLE